MAVLDKATVAEAAAWLDGFKPGWAEKVDLETFNFDNELRCILGQVFGDYSTGRTVLVEAGALSAYDSDDYNFYHPFNNYGNVTAQSLAWRSEVERRQA